MNLCIPTDNMVDHMGRICDYVSAGFLSVLEIGVENGTGTTQAIRSGFEAGIETPGKRLWVSVDVVRQVPEWIAPRFPWWHFVVGDSRNHSTAETVRGLMDGIGGFDLILIDTIHTADFMARELEVWSPLAATDCLWLFHDTWMNGVYNPMTDAIKAFAEKSGRWMYYDESKACHGLGSLIPKTVLL